MEPRLAQMLVGILLVATIVGPLLAIAGTSTAAATSSTCDQSVSHTAFRTDEAIETVNQTGKAVSTASNTEVTIEETTGFVRLKADNPNGYCVSYTVEIAPEIVAPADLGDVASNDEETSASWRAAQNLSSGEVYTRVTFTLAANETATFAPSTVRVQSLSWTGTAKEKSSGLIGSLSSWFGDEDLEKRHYTIEPTSSSSRITVPLTNSSGAEVEEWRATYEVDGTTKPVTQDASAPVYYTESGKSVTFHFSQKAVEDGTTVNFVANPNWRDEISYSARSYWSGVREIGSWLPSVALPAEVIA